MSASFIDSLPESYRKHYQNITINPKSSSVQFETLNKAEIIKENTRKNSNLYSIFGERLFGIYTFDGRLHLEIDLFSKDSIIRTLERELELLETCRCMLASVGEGTITPPEHLTDARWKQMHFGVPEMIESIKEDKTAIEEAIQKVEAVFTEKLESVYFEKKIRDDLQSITKMYREISGRRISQHQSIYLRLALTPKVIDKSIVSINWRQYL